MVAYWDVTRRGNSLPPCLRFSGCFRLWSTSDYLLVCWSDRAGRRCTRTQRAARIDPIEACAIRWHRRIKSLLRESSPGLGPHIRVKILLEAF